ncbi:MAG: hypothetical protein IJT05_04705 [Lachnospiraceae bacterium]|nr:hypothetical protein [Lachnospiraceae bacterium]
MDIKAKIEEVLGKIKSDPNFKKSFEENPEKALESAAGIDIPDGMLDGVISGIKAKLSADQLGGAFDAIRKLTGG